MIQSHRAGAFRRFVVASAVGAATITAVAMPLTAAAAPAGVSAPAARRGIDDPIAPEAVQALATLDRGIASRSADELKSFDQARDHIAAEVAVRLELGPAVLQAAWRRADRDHQQAILGAMTQLGVPYRHNALKPGEGFDCSGLTTYAWSFAGIMMQHQSSAQIRAAAPRTALTAQAGDLVQYPGHVMIWLGVDRAMIHAPYSGRNVEVDNFSARRKVNYGDPTG
jgi:cell wall-associated NlpC family hydrolase